jgi:hypothetical protein
MKNRTKVVDTLLLGAALWLLGYLASMILYSVVPYTLLGWVLSAILTPITLCIAYLRFNHRKDTAPYYVKVGVVWALVAIILDYIFLVRLLNLAGYYKLDVFIYYIAMFLIPLAIGLRYGRKGR